MHYVVKGLEHARGASGANRTRKEQQQEGRNTQKRRKEKNVERIIDFIVTEIEWGNPNPSKQEIMDHFNGERGFSMKNIERIIKETPELTIKGGLVFYKPTSSVTDDGLSKIGQTSV